MALHKGHLGTLALHYVQVSKGQWYDTMQGSLGNTGMALCKGH